MYQVTTSSLLLFDRGFCSNGRRPLPPIRTIEEGVKVIEAVLSKGMFCCHDIDDINGALKAIDKLEKKVERLPERNSHYVLKQIIGKVEVVFRDTAKSPETLITLYHMHRFTGSKLPLSEYFNYRLKESDRGPAQIQRLAASIPYCVSEKQFNQDALTLIGENPPPKTIICLDRKRKRLRDHQALLESIALKKGELSESRKANPSKSYPPFLDEFLEHGFVQLYDHFLKIREFATIQDRKKKIEEMSFSDISFVILQTREAIIKTVVEAIPSDRNNILFLIGGTGSGKSTTLCYLRGDKMKLNGNNYDSETDGTLIGHEFASSCTFLPTVEIGNDLILVDFPGFDDTNGPLISLGLELALKSLIKRYQPKILVLESITNIEGRFKAAAELGGRLDRLLENREQCILGVTKYSKDPDYIAVKNIEEKQLEEQFSEILVRIAGLEKTIEDLRASNDNSEKTQSQIKTKEQELAALRESLKLLNEQPLPEMDKKITHKKSLEAKEQELLKQTGLGSIIKFDDLEDLPQKTACLQNLTETPAAIRAKSVQTLDPNDRKLMDQIFENKLLTVIQSDEDYYSGITDIKEFESQVLESSVTQTILSESHPEIGCLLHLPEMDPTVVRQFDKKIVGSCIRNVIGVVVKVFDLVFLDNIMKDVGTKASSKTIQNFKGKLDQLKKYIIGLLGLNSQTDKEIRDSWKQIKENYKYEEGVIARSSGLPTWAKALLCLPAGIPYAIFLLVDIKRRAEEIRRLSDETIGQYSAELDELFSVLVGLKEIELTITKQEEIEKAFVNRLLSISNVEMLQETTLTKIRRIREIYGAEDWDAKVSLLKNRFSFPPDLSPCWPNLIACELLDNAIWMMRLPSLLSEIPNVSFREQASANRAFVLETKTETVIVQRGNHALTSIRIMKDLFEKADKIIPQQEKNQQQVDAIAPIRLMKNRFVKEDGLKEASKNKISVAAILVEKFIKRTEKICRDFIIPQITPLITNIRSLQKGRPSLDDENNLSSESREKFYRHILIIMNNALTLLWKYDYLLSSNPALSKQFDEKWREYKMDSIAFQLLECIVPKLKLQVDWKKSNAEELSRMNLQNPLHRTLLAAIALEHGKVSLAEK